MKTHALRRDVHLRRELRVGDDADWALMRDLAPGLLICPEPGCRTELTAVLNAQGTRFLRRRRGSVDCSHSFTEHRCGGPMTPQHEWLRGEVARLCNEIGFTAFEEDYATHADVLVETDPPWAIEIQRVATDYTIRTRAREVNGAKVLWLLPDNNNGGDSGDALFGHSAARIRVLDPHDLNRRVCPWEPEEKNAEFRLYAGATVLQPNWDCTGLQSAGNYELRRFLYELFTEQRTWSGARKPRIATTTGWIIGDHERLVRRNLAARSERRALDSERQADSRPIDSTPSDEAPVAEICLPESPEPVKPIEASVEEPLIDGPTSQLEIPSPLTPVAPASANENNTWYKRVWRWMNKPLG